LFGHPAPGPLAGVRAEARADRIPEDVLDSVPVVLLVADDPAGEAVAPEVAPAAVAGVELLRMDPVQALKAGREERNGSLDEQVVVVREERERVDAPGVAVDGARQEREERSAVVVVADDGATVDAFRGDVVDAGLRQRRARDPCHIAERTAPATASAPPWTKSHTFVTEAVSLRAMSGDCPRTWPKRTCRAPPADYGESRSTRPNTRRGSGTWSSSSSPATKVP